MKITQNQKKVRVELEREMNPQIIGAPGACAECVQGQLGNLDRPYGQGHFLCNPIPKNALEAIRKGFRTTKFVDGEWVIVNA